MECGREGARPAYPAGTSLAHLRPAPVVWRGASLEVPEPVGDELLLHFPHALLSGPIPLPLASTFSLLFVNARAGQLALEVLGDAGPLHSL